MGQEAARKTNIILREVVKNGYLAVRLTVRVNPPPYGQGFVIDISQNMSTYFGKITRQGGGVNPYGQPDRKKTVFFYDRP